MLIYVFINSSLQSKYNHKFDILLILYNVNNMRMHNILWEFALWHKKWNALPYNHPIMHQKFIAHMFPPMEENKRQVLVWGKRIKHLVMDSK
jgi:hypothetical protein